MRQSDQRPRPRGYMGHNHEMLGGPILAVLKILKMPEQVLGVAEAQALAHVDPASWYPVERMLELTDKLDAHVGHYGLVRMGRTLFEGAHGQRAKDGAKSARDILYGFDAMYRQANRGMRIGGWKVLRFEPGEAVMEKTTPHHCMMEQGILMAALNIVGCPVTITQSTCLREGADACTMLLTSAITDERWSGAAT